jgi:hypothetical protein
MSPRRNKVDPGWMFRRRNKVDRGWMFQRWNVARAMDIKTSGYVKSLVCEGY